MLAERGDRLLVIANEISGNMASVVGIQHGKSRKLYGNHLSSTPGPAAGVREKRSVADFFLSPKHGAQQRRSSDPFAARKPSSTTEIGAMVGAAIHPRLQNRTHHRLGSETLCSLYPVQVAREGTVSAYTLVTLSENRGGFESRPFTASYCFKETTFWKFSSSSRNWSVPNRLCW